MIVLWIIVVMVHFLGCIAVVVAGCLLPFCGAPWPVWFTLGTLLVQMVFDANVTCILTDFENYLRRKIQWPEIDGFVNHYFLNR